MNRKGEGGVRGWICGDENGREMLCRVVNELQLPPPFHKLPLRFGNVIELIGSSPCAKTHLLMLNAIHFLLPTRFGGLGLLVVFFDLDCRFDILRFSQLLKSRIHQTDDSDELFKTCMSRFLYVPCYDSLQFLSTLKTLHYQLQKESDAQGGLTVNFLLIIDSVGAFHWLDRASTSFHFGDNSRKGLSLQNIWETVVHEIKKLLLVHPMLVIASKATILGNRNAANEVKWNPKKSSSSDAAISSVPNHMRQLVHREYMPSVWQSFVTLRILIQGTVYFADRHISTDKNHDKSVYLCEWLLPSQSVVNSFFVEDAGVICLS